MYFRVVCWLAAASCLQAQFRFVVIGDTGSGSKAQGRVAEQMWEWREKNPFNLVLMLGDNIYGNHEVSGGGDPRLFPAKFDAFYQRFQEEGVVFHAVIGNHDMQTRRGQAEIDDQQRFGILGPDGYYKFSSPDGSVDFFAINSELRAEKMTQQVAWLKEELGNSKAVWKFVFLHHPLYTVRGQHAPAVALREQIQDTLKRDHVQFILAGHNHFYARLKPVDQTVQLISGGGGRHLAFPRMDHCAEISARKYHFLAVEVFPDKVHFIAVDQYGDIFDEQTVDAAYLQTSTKGCPVR
jgi:hypothetical protein